MQAQYISCTLVEKNYEGKSFLLESDFEPEIVLSALKSLLGAN